MIMGISKIKSKFSGWFSGKNKSAQPSGKPEQPSKKSAKSSKKTPADEKYMKSISEIFRQFKEEELKKERFVVMGMGNDLKGDDGVGFYVVDRLSKEFKGESGFLFIKTSVPEDRVREIRNFAPNMVIIIDAADFGKRPGSIKIIKEYQISGLFISTHTTPLTLFLKLYQADQPVKSAVTIIGVQRKSSEFGQPMCGDVKKAGDMVAKIISELYRKKLLDKILESEIERRSNPLKRIAGSLRKK